MKTILKHSALFLLFNLIGMMAFAQPDQEPDDEKRKEKLAALKRAYMTEKLDLTSEEAEKFWPVYNAYEKKREELRKSMRELQNKVDTEEVTDKALIETIDAMDKKRKEEVDLDSKFLKDCLPILGAKKVVKLSKMEQEFRQKMMEVLKERREEKREERNEGRPGGPGRK